MPYSPNAGLNYENIIGDEYDCYEQFKLFDFIAKNSTDLIDQTKKKGVEHGFSVCRDGNRFKIHRVCIGDENCLQIDRCETGNVGEFHTHPGGETFPSLSDGLSSMGQSLTAERHGHEFLGSCIGGDSDITCYTPDDELVKAFKDVTDKLVLFERFEPVSEEFAESLAYAKYPHDNFRKMAGEFVRLLRTGDYYPPEHMQEFFDVETMSKCMRLYSRRVPRR